MYVDLGKEIVYGVPEYPRHCGDFEWYKKMPKVRPVVFKRERWLNSNVVTVPVYRCQDCQRVFLIEDSTKELQHACTIPKHR